MAAKQNPDHITWQRFAFLASCTLQPHSKKTIRPGDLLQTTASPEEGLPGLSEEERREIKQSVPDAAYSAAFLRRKHEKALRDERDPVQRQEHRDTIERLSRLIQKKAATEHNGD